MDAPEPPAPDRTPPDQTAPPICSAKGCRGAARWALRWNNPKLHTPQRRKTWLACDDHREHLAGFLTARGLLREIEPMPGSAGGSPGRA